MKYQEIVEKLLEENPDFKRRGEELYLDLPFDVAGAFANFIVDLVDGRTPPNNIAIDRAFRFINELGTSEDNEVQDLLVTGILEVLADSANARDTARRLLDPSVREMFEKTIRGWWGAKGAQRRGPLT